MDGSRPFYGSISYDEILNSWSSILWRFVVLNYIKVHWIFYLLPQGKLDAYRDTLQRGKSLNEDQQAAVAKYDEVIGTLEFARELSGQFTKLALDEAKDKKKMMKKEQQERAKVELIKVVWNRMFSNYS